MDQAQVQTLLHFVSFSFSLFHPHSLFYYIQHPASSSRFSSCPFFHRFSALDILCTPPSSCKIHIHVFQPARLLGPKTQLLAWSFVCNWAYIRTTNTNETSSVGVFDVIDLFQYLEGRVGSVQCTHPYIYSCRCPFRPPLLRHIDPSSLFFLSSS